MSVLEELRQQFEAVVKEESAKIEKKEPVGLFEPVSYALQMGGKRIRPVLVLTAARMFSGNVEAALPVAMAFETFHNFTLLHDDIMDKADIRRGRATVHKKYDENTAILSGDAMSIQAYEYLAKAPLEVLPEVLNLFSQTAMEVCEGQQYDMEFEQRDDVSVDEYMKMIRLKTAVLIAASLKAGAIIGGAAKEDADRLYEFGINIGLAFQLQDDWLDCFGDSSVFGKKIGGDIRSNKKTYMMLRALELTEGKLHDELVGWISEDGFEAEEKVKSVLAIYTQCEVDKKAKKLMSEYYDKAIQDLERINLPSDKKYGLFDMAEQVISRIL